MPIFVVVYTVYYGLPIFILTPTGLQENFQMPLFEVDIDKCLLLAIAGLVAIILGFYCAGRRRRSSLLSLELIWEDTRAIEIVSCVVGLLSLPAFWVSGTGLLPSALRQPIALVGDLYYMSVIALFILQLEHRSHLLCRLLLWGVLLPARAAIGILLGRFGFAVLVALVLWLVYTTLRRRTPWLLIVAGFALFCLLQPAKTAFRGMVYSNGVNNIDQPSSEKLEAFTISAELAWNLFKERGAEDVISLATERLAQLIVFVQVAQLTPSTVAYWQGDSYYSLLLKVVPRFIYPAKPEDQIGNDFGHQYSFIARTDYTTSISLPQLVEFYGNFGPIGVVIGSLLVGAFYRVLHDVFFHSCAGFGALVGGLFLLNQWLNFEDNLSLVLGGVFGSLLSIFAFHRAVLAVSAFRKVISQRSRRGRARVEA